MKLPRLLQKLFNAAARRKKNPAGPLPPEQYYKTLPRKIGASGILLLKDGKMLALETGYQDTLTIPGGVVEKNESFVEAAVREGREEIGATVAITSLLCVDYGHDDTFRGDGVRFIFLGDLAGQEVRPDNVEIKNAIWIAPEEAMKRMTPSLARRLEAALTGLREGRTVYCEDGIEPSYSPPPSKNSPRP